MSNQSLGRRAVRLQSQTRRRKPRAPFWLLLLLLGTAGCAQTVDQRSTAAPQPGTYGAAGSSRGGARNAEHEAPEALTVVHQDHPLRVWFKPRSVQPARGAMLLLHGRTW
ncbi:MAG: hypothetical protein AAGG11_24630, partial [Pseudomonadota bacterium]